jgi:hypothetical protein
MHQSVSDATAGGHGVLREEKHEMRTAISLFERSSGGNNHWVIYESCKDENEDHLLRCFDERRCVEYRPMDQSASGLA